MVRRSVIFIIFLLSIIAFSVDCFAQSNWHITPSLTVSETYDGNIFSTKTEVADYVTKVGANLNTTYNSTNADVRGNYLASYNAYAKRPKENVVTHDGAININLNRWLQNFFDKGEVTVSEDFTVTPDLRDYYFDEEKGGIGSLSSQGIRTTRSDALRNAIALNVVLPMTSRVSLSANYSNLLTEYRNSKSRDNVTNTVGAGARYAYPVDVIYTDVSMSTIREGFDDSISYSLILGVRHHISQLTIFDVNAGIVTLDHEARSNNSTFRGGMSLTKQSRTHTYSTGYSSSLNTVSSTIGGVPSKADIFYLSISNIHSESLTSNIGANYAINRSFGSGEVDTRSYNLSGSVNYIIRKWLKCSLTDSYFNQVSKGLTVSDIKRNMITFALTGTWN